MSSFSQSASTPAPAGSVTDRPGHIGARRARVLVLRSCRPAQFAAAVAGVRQRMPDAEVVALSHPGHDDSLRAAGVDRVVALSGKRFGLLRTAPWTLLRLRRERFDEAVIPQMTAHAAGYGNLYRLVAAVGARRVTILRGEDGPLTTSGDAFVRYAFRDTSLDVVGWVQGPFFLLMLLAAAWAWPRRTVVSRPRRRVLHVISSLGVGGAQRQLAELVNRTPVDRYAVDVLVLGRSDGDFARQWFTRDVHITYLTQWPRLVSSTLEVRRHCAGGDYDLVHCWLFMANVIGVAGARLAGTPQVIASVRNLSLWKRRWYRQWWFRAADTMSTHAADVVTVNAEALAADHGTWTWYPVPGIEIVHNGLEPSQFLVDVVDARQRVRAAAGLPPDAVVVGTVGRLAPEKDQNAFLRIIAAVRKVDARVHGVVVGDGQLRSQLEALAEQLGLAGHVTFLGQRDDARRLMAGFDVFVLTSTIEGFPNVLLEAAFLGVPSVSSRVGGSPDILANPRDLFEPGDTGTATRRVLALLGDRIGAASDAELTRQRAFTKFTADQTARRWFALYDRLPNSGEGHEA